MKILLGAHGTGKSTLLKEVRKELPSYYITDGFSRPVTKLGSLLGFSNLTKQTILNELTLWAYENHLNQKNIISTRSIVDCIIYSQILTPELDLEQLITCFETTKHKVEYFFYIPVEFPFVADELRTSDEWEELQVKIDQEIRSFITTHIPREKVVTIRGTVDERVDRIINYL